jgi:hypothetical protein
MFSLVSKVFDSTEFLQLVKGRGLSLAALKCSCESLNEEDSSSVML